MELEGGVSKYAPKTPHFTPKVLTNQAAITTPPSPQLTQNAPFNGNPGGPALNTTLDWPMGCGPKGRVGLHGSFGATVLLLGRVTAELVRHCMDDCLGSLPFQKNSQTRLR